MDESITVSVGPSAAHLTIDVQRCRTLYRRLMATYALLLGDVTSLERAPGEEWDQITERIRRQSKFTHSFTMFLTRTHIRKRLRFLAARCGQLEPALDPNNHEQRKLREWLASVRDAADVTTSALPGQLPRFFVLASFLFGLAPFLKPLFSADVDGGFLTFLLLYFSGIAIVTSPYFFVAYREKRELFYPGTTALDSQRRSIQVEHAGPNTYGLEEDLFLALAAEPPVEADLDVIVMIIATSLLATVGGFIVVWRTSSLLYLFITMVGIALVGFALMIRMYRRHRHRWR